MTSLPRWALSIRTRDSTETVCRWCGILRHHRCSRTESSTADHGTSRRLCLRSRIRNYRWTIQPSLADAAADVACPRQPPDTYLTSSLSSASGRVRIFLQHNRSQQILSYMIRNPSAKVFPTLNRKRIVSGIPSSPNIIDASLPSTVRGTTRP